MIEYYCPKGQKGELYMKEYFVICKIDGDECYSIETTESLADMLETDNEAGCIDDITVYDPQAGMKKVDAYEVTKEYREQKAAMQAEYEEYCETVNEYGYGYYENQDMLEMGFNPYTGSYDDDC